MFTKSAAINLTNLLTLYGQAGVEALSAATPKDSGETAGSWSYEIVQKPTGVAIVWSNSNMNDGANIAVLLQYGHGTRNGGYVQGVDYINPALKPIFERIANEAWKEVTS
ncbi:MAG TPA: HK97 gp10 family phage protein [Candidatus Limiplasma sp.]|nr:HK97 gp10 family phage protein [Candidatus Limiplasma sp.]